MIGPGDLDGCGQCRRCTPTSQIKNHQSTFINPSKRVAGTLRLPSRPTARRASGPLRRQMHKRRKGVNLSLSPASGEDQGGSRSGHGEDASLTNSPASGEDNTAAGGPVIRGDGRTADRPRPVGGRLAAASRPDPRRLPASVSGWSPTARRFALAKILAACRRESQARILGAAFLFGPPEWRPVFVPQTASNSKAVTTHGAPNQKSHTVSVCRRSLALSNRREQRKRS